MFENTCPGCGKIIQFDIEDLRHSTFTDRFLTFGLDYVCCPECHTVMPFRIIDEETGELHSDFTFNT